MNTLAIEIKGIFGDKICTATMIDSEKPCIYRIVLEDLLLGYILKNNKGEWVNEGGVSSLLTRADIHAIGEKIDRQL